MKIDGGTLTGKAWWDPQLGLLVNSATEQHRTLTSTERAKATTKFNLTLNFRRMGVTDAGK